MDVLQDMGVKVVDYEEGSFRGRSTEEEEVGEYEKTEDLVQAYFHSMGDISILTKDEETELAKRLEEGREIIKEIVTACPSTEKLEETLEVQEEEAMRMQKKKRPMKP